MPLGGKKRKNKTYERDHPTAVQPGTRKNGTGELTRGKKSRMHSRESRDGLMSGHNGILRLKRGNRNPRLLRRKRGGSGGEENAFAGLKHVDVKPRSSVAPKSIARKKRGLLVVRKAGNNGGGYWRGEAPCSVCCKEKGGAPEKEVPARIWKAGIEEISARKSFRRGKWRKGKEKCF